MRRKTWKTIQWKCAYNLNKRGLTLVWFGCGVDLRTGGDDDEKWKWHEAAERNSSDEESLNRSPRGSWAEHKYALIDWLPANNNKERRFSEKWKLFFGADVNFHLSHLGGLHDNTLLMVVDAWLLNFPKIEISLLIFFLCWSIFDFSTTEKLHFLAYETTSSLTHRNRSKRGDDSEIEKQTQQRRVNMSIVGRLYQLTHLMTCGNKRVGKHL